VAGVLYVILNMKTSLQTLFFTLAFIPLSAFSKEQDHSLSVAESWVNSLMQANIGTTYALSDTPFSLDKRKLIATSDELLSIYQSIAKKKGARDLQVSEVKVIPKDKAPTPFGLKTEVITVAATVSGEPILVFVDPNKNYRVVGFAD
jgi:hypothetical protein